MLTLNELWDRYKIWISSPIFSFALALFLYYFQKVSLLSSILLFILFIIIPIAYVLFKELIAIRNQLWNIRNLKNNMVVTIRILNKKGDASIHTKFKIRNRENSPVEFLYKDIFSTPGKSIKLYKPRVLDSSIKDICIEERIKHYYTKKIKIDGADVTHNYVDCDYRISPALRFKGDYIEYELLSKAKEHCTINSNENINIEGFIVKNIASYLEMNLISPKKSKIELLDFWVEDSQANRLDYLKSILIPPRICANGELLKWFIEYPRMNCLYLFKYKIIKQV